MPIKHIMYAPRDGSIVLGYTPGIGWNTIVWDNNKKLWKRAGGYLNQVKRHPVVFDTDSTPFTMDNYTRQMELDRYVYDNRFVLTRGRKPNGASL